MELIERKQGKMTHTTYRFEVVVFVFPTSSLTEVDGLEGKGSHLGGRDGVWLRGRKDVKLRGVW